MSRIIHNSGQSRDGKKTNDFKPSGVTMKASPLAVACPWLTFNLDLSAAPIELWHSLGEVEYLCEEISTKEVPSEIATVLSEFSFAKIVSTAITPQRPDGVLMKDYTARDCANVVGLANSILDTYVRDGPTALNATQIQGYNQILLEGALHHARTKPGCFRNYAIRVNTYRAVPWQECAALVERLCTWLNGRCVNPIPDDCLGAGLVKAIVAHLYLVWIHPFGDGNGRTSRMIEFRLMLEAGVPSCAAHQLSNHYNLTRRAYYDRLDEARKSNSGLLEFLLYAVQGLAQRLNEQCVLINKASRQGADLAYHAQV